MIEQEPSHVGTMGWAMIGAFVIAWDIMAPETLSGAVDRALDHPIGRIAAIGGVAVTGAHLLNLLPDQYDPFVKTFSVLDKARHSMPLVVRSS